LQAGTGHAAATGGTEGVALIISESLHLLAAGAWLGGLFPLLIGLWHLSSDASARLSHRFSPLGFGCVLVLAGTGMFQANALVDRRAAIFDTPYGHMILIKLALFAILLLLAVLNRFTLTARLPDSRGWLLASVAIETGFGVAIILAAARLASLAPIRSP
jgi:putative copper resistance protein D